MQVKLLRVIQEREVIRLGETRTRRVDVRLMAATNRDLLEEVAQRSLSPRSVLPAPRDRPARAAACASGSDELLGLAHELLAQTAARLRRPVVGYTPRALECLLDYAWPGNIRELEHAIERACAVATGSQIDVEDLPGRGARRRRVAQNLPVAARLMCEKSRTSVPCWRVIGGHRRRAAEELGISLSTLKRRLASAGSLIVTSRLASTVGSLLTLGV